MVRSRPECLLRLLPRTDRPVITASKINRHGIPPRTKRWPMSGSSGAGPEDIHSPAPACHGPLPPGPVICLVGTVCQSASGGKPASAGRLAPPLAVGAGRATDKTGTWGDSIGTSSARAGPISLPTPPCPQLTNGYRPKSTSKHARETGPGQHRNRAPAFPPAAGFRGEAIAVPTQLTVKTGLPGVKEHPSGARSH